MRSCSGPGAGVERLCFQHEGEDDGGGRREYAEICHEALHTGGQREKQGDNEHEAELKVEMLPPGPADLCSRCDAAFCPPSCRTKFPPQLPVSSS